MSPRSRSRLGKGFKQIHANALMPGKSTRFDQIIRENFGSKTAQDAFLERQTHLSLEDKEAVRKRLWPEGGQVPAGDHSAAFVEGCVAPRMTMSVCKPPRNPKTLAALSELAQRVWEHERARAAHSRAMTRNREIPLEEQDQAEFVSWLRSEHPDWRFYAVPNGGGRSKREGAALKGQGVSSGVPDMVFPVPRGRFRSLYLENKRANGGRLSPDQAEWLVYLKAQGFQIAVAHGLAQMKAVAEAYFCLPAPRSSK